jgi:hydroxymethylpyrimidine/phosphomethylpyrimidine kinase
VERMQADLVAEQLDVLLNDVPPHVVKTGALGSAAVVRAVARRVPLRGVPLVIDPVCVSTSGALLLDDDGIHVLRDELLPRATLVTPNLAEASLLVGQPVATLDEMRDAAVALCKLGPSAVLVKGGHRLGNAVDVLCSDGALYELSEPRIVTTSTHGLGCALSAAIAARLALGTPMVQACSGAKDWLTRALRTAPGIGGGRGPINHLEPAEPKLQADR